MSFFRPGKTLVWNWYFLIQCNVTDKGQVSFLYPVKFPEMDAATKEGHTSIGYNVKILIEVEVCVKQKI